MSLDIQSENNSLEANLSNFVTNLKFDDLPEKAVRTAERCFLDTIGVALAGSVEPPGRIAATVAEIGGGGEGEVTILGSDAKSDAMVAALVNGTAAHALDYDDVTRADTGHPSAPLIPSALAVGELIGASGRDLLTAYVAGFEVANYVGSAIHPGHYKAGWHSTGTYGTFSATGAACSLLDLDRLQTQHALNIAASSPAGSQRNFGSMTKSFHAGQAARAGVTAALLAANGFTANPNAISEKNGFFDLYHGPDGVDDGAIPIFGEEFAICTRGVQAKKYPCCYRTHPTIAAVADLVARHDIQPQEVDVVHVTGSEKGPQILIHDDPKTGFEGKFSMEYTAAAGIVCDTIDLSTFEDEMVNDPNIQYVRERVEYEADPTIPYNDYETTVVIETVDGERFHIVRENPPGRVEPISDIEMKEKFLDCSSRALDADASQRAYERIDDFRHLDTNDISTTLDLLRG